MADIISIATAVPKYCHRQEDIIELMAKIHKLEQTEKRKLAFLYNHSGIETRYSVIDDYSLPEHEWDFLPLNGNSFPSLEERMKIFDVKGRLMKTLLNNQASGSTGQVVYNGLDDENRKLRLGIYVVFIEALNGQNGVVETIKTTMVVAAKL